MIKEKEEKLINMAKEIIEMTDSVIGITGKIAGLGSEDFALLKEWFFEVTGRELSIPKDAVEVRKRMMDYLREKNVSFKEDPKYEIHQSNFSSDFLNHWDQDDQFSRKSR